MKIWTWLRVLILLLALIGLFMLLRDKPDVTAQVIKDTTNIAKKTVEKVDILSEKTGFSDYLSEKKENLISKIKQKI